MGVIMTHHHLTADKAYIVLRTRAAEAGGDLVDTATSVLHGRV
jgi:AmiR/NasT family two-component response regulator